MNYRYKLIIISLMVLQLAGCAGSGEVIFYRPAGRADVEITGGRAGLIRTLYCDIYAEYVDNEGWSSLKKHKQFKGRGKGNPADPCFHFVVVNTWDKPLVIDKIDLIYSGGTIASEDYSFIKDQSYTDDRYSLSILSLLKKRRILSDQNMIGEIDYSSETVEYRLDFIAPGDKLSIFSFFPRIPSGRPLKIRVTIKYFDLKKVIDFDIGRFEYKDIEFGNNKFD